MRWIIWRRVRLALMTMPRLASGTSMPSSSTRGRGDRIETAHAEVVEDLAALTARRRSGDQVDRHQRIEPVDRVVRGADRLGEEQRAVGVLDRAGQAAEQLVLATRLGHDLTALRERVEILTRGASVGARVAFGEVRDRGEEVAEVLDRHAVHRSQMAARVDELLFGLEVLGAFFGRQLHADEGDARPRAHPVCDRVLEAVAMADAAEVGEQEIGDGVVRAFEGRGQPEALLVLGQQRPAQDPAAEAVALVRDQESAARRPEPACTSPPSAGSRRGRHTSRGRRDRCRRAVRSGRRAAPPAGDRTTAPSAPATAPARARNDPGAAHRRRPRSRCRSSPSR